MGNGRPNSCAGCWMQPPKASSSARRASARPAGGLRQRRVRAPERLWRGRADRPGPAPPAVLGSGPGRRNQLRAAIAQGETCRVLLRNYRKDGSQFWNEVLVQPLRGAEGSVTHFVGFHRDVGERERSGLATLQPGLPSWLREDRLSGLCSRAYFEELLQHDWQVGAREARLLTLLVFDIDDLASYNDTFGRAAGDACIRRVAGVIGAAFQARRRRGGALGRRTASSRWCAVADLEWCRRSPARWRKKCWASTFIIRAPRAGRSSSRSASAPPVCIRPESKALDVLVQAVMQGAVSAPRKITRHAIAVAEAGGHQLHRSAAGSCMLGAGAGRCCSRLAALGGATTAAPVLLGRWLTEPRDGIIEISVSPMAATRAGSSAAMRPHGSIVKNPDASRRQQLLLGQIIMLGMNRGRRQCLERRHHLRSRQRPYLQVPPRTPRSGPAQGARLHRRVAARPLPDLDALHRQIARPAGADALTPGRTSG